MIDPKPIGEHVEDVVEDVVSSTSPTEDETTDSGTDDARRRGHEALGDEAQFSA